MCRFAVGDSAVEVIDGTIREARIVLHGVQICSSQRASASGRLTVSLGKRSEMTCGLGSCGFER